MSQVETNKQLAIKDYQRILGDLDVAGVDEYISNKKS
jgi:hypothetical protein